MKNRKSLVLIFILCITCSFLFVDKIEAADIGDYIDGSYLIDADSSDSISTGSTRGVYLGSGSSSLSKAGTSKITAGGTTIAQKVVATVSVTVRVERLVNGSWQIYDSWSSTRYNAASATSSKTLSVPSGYYYRTHCFHSANSDSSGSVTNGLWI